IKVAKEEHKNGLLFNVEGQLFFASVEGFVNSFDFTVENRSVVIDFSNSHIWDDSAVGAIDKVVIKYREQNNSVTIKGLDSASKKIVDKLAIYNNNSNKKMPAH
ncbi:STAS domain-containing protein, partial [Peribacillus frigoritolerans]|nr:STAS domain-containing protein [Peribacillus castrilensis]